MTSTSPPVIRGPYAKGVQRRQEILDATLDVIDDKGFEATSLRAIGDAIGVSHAALRHYFSSREELLVEVLKERDAKTTSRIAGRGSVFDRMAAAADDNVRQPGGVALHTVLTASAVESGNELSRAFFTERFARGRDILQEEIEAELARRGRTTDVDVSAVAALVLAAFDGLQVQWLLDRSIDIGATLRLLERILG